MKIPAPVKLRRLKLNPEEITVVKLGLQSLKLENPYLQKVRASLLNKLSTSDYFIVIYFSGRKTRRKTSQTLTKE